MLYGRYYPIGTMLPRMYTVLYAALPYTVCYTLLYSYMLYTKQHTSIRYSIVYSDRAIQKSASK